MDVNGMSSVTNSSLNVTKEDYRQSKIQDLLTHRDEEDLKAGNYIWPFVNLSHLFPHLVVRLLLFDLI